MKTKKEINKICEIYKETQNVSKVARQVDATRKTIRKYLKERGLKEYSCSSSNNDGKPKEIDHNAFYGNNLNEQQKYWIGFLMADGCVQTHKDAPGNPQITLGLQNKDRKHIEKYRDFLNSEHKIIEDNNGNPMLKFRSKNIFIDLKKHGVIPNKSSIGTEVKILKDDRHFWRGVVDGDGSINKPDNLTRLSLAGCKRVLEQFKNFSKNITNSNTKVHHHINSTCRYNVNGEQANKLLKELYIDQSIALERKERRAISHLTSYDYTQE